MIRKSIIAVATLTVLALSAVVSAAEFPAELLEKISAMKADVEAKKEVPASLPGITTVSTAEAAKMLKGKKAVFLDNRIKSQYDTEKIPGADWFFTDDLMKDPAKADRLDKNKEYVVYCNGPLCWRSPAAALLLSNLGFKKVYFFRDGLPGWKKGSNPTE